MEEEEFPAFLAGLAMGSLIGIIFFAVINSLSGASNIDLKQASMDEICNKLNALENPGQDLSFEGEVNYEGKLVCKYPSYDSTQSIIFKLNQED